MQIWELYSEKETLALGKKLGEQAAPGSTYCLQGDLGTGKTVLAKGLALGLGVQEDIVSPTFTIVQEYSGRLPLYHFDIYRLANEDELWDICWEEYIGSGGVCLVEWADLMPEAMPEEAVWLTIEKDLSKGIDYRKIKIESGKQHGIIRN